VNKKHKQVNIFFFKIFADSGAMVAAKIFADSGAMVAARRTKICENNLKVMKVSNRWKQDS
jgi:hypothetical protein